MPSTLATIVERLEAHAGEAFAAFDGPFAFVLLEQIAYLASDERRRAAFEALATRVGLLPERLLAVPRETLVAICRLGGINAEERAERIRRSATIVLERCDGDLTNLARLPLRDARTIARAFDGFGAANAEGILLFAGVPVPALDSNGVRVLSRVWFGGETDRYATAHRRACDAIASDKPPSVDLLRRGFLTLRRHGQTVCRRSDPHCSACPLGASCSSFARTEGHR